MKKIMKHGLYALAATALLAACAEDNVADYQVPAPEGTQQAAALAQYQPIKASVNRGQYAGLKMATAMSIADFNKRELMHAAAATNFDEVVLTEAMTAGATVNAEGATDFAALNTALDNAAAAGVTVFGHTLAWHAQQAKGWMDKLLAPIEVVVEFLVDKELDFSAITSYTGTTGALATLSDGTKVLEVKDKARFDIIDGFEVDPALTYEITLMVKATKNLSLIPSFSGTSLDKVSVTTEWQVVTMKAKPKETAGHLYINQGNFKGSVYYTTVKVGHYPDNHRDQTAQEKTDTVNYAVGTWCNAVMKACAGRVKAWNLINEPLSEGGDVNGYYDLLHAADGAAGDFFWQDYLGSEQYAPAFEQAARTAYAAYSDDADALKLFVNESNLENDADDNKKLKSLIYWVGVWEQKGARIDGLGTQMHLTYYEDKAVMRSKTEHIVQMFRLMAETGKLVRISELDMKYVDADGNAVKTVDLTAEQRQNVANYYRYVIQMYLKLVPAAQQYGICLSSMTDGAETVGLWTEGWDRTVAYAAYCEALSKPLPETEVFE